jgi:acyl carrier protein
MIEPNSFCKLLADSLGTSAVITPSTVMLDLPEFDSMGQVSLRAMADEHFNRIVTEEEIAACVTVADLHALLSKKTE